MKRFFAFGAVFLWLAFQNAAAQDILSINTRVYSKDKSHYIYLSEKSVGTIEARMYRVGETESEWSAWIDWSRSSYGIVANDGSAFVVIECEYSEYRSPIIVYGPFAPQAYSVKALGIALEYLALDGNRRYWVEPIRANFSVNYSPEKHALSVDVRMLNEKWIRIGLPR